MSQVPSLRDIEMFNLVATELSFRRAAERMAIDQSALSRRIRQLEEQLGFQLIRRTTREVSHTSAGEIFHEETRLIDTQISSAMETARIAAEGKRGRLRIGYMSFAATEIMPTIVREFIQLYPDIDLTLKYIRTQGQKIDLARNEIDAGFMLGPFWHQQFACQPISRELLMAVLPVNHRLAGRTSVTLAELSRYPLILGSMAEWDFFRRHLADVFAWAGVEVETCRYEVSDALGILGLVGAGLGVSIFPSSIMRFQPRTVMTVPISDPKGAIETILMWNRAYRNKVLDNFISVARETYGPMGRQY